jgi:glycosyltransferase involved in cell wall biosynthesis
MSSFNNIRKAGGNVRYIPNGVNTLIFRPVSGEKKISIRKKYGFSPKDKIILHVGHINKNRNIHELTKLHLSGYKLLVVGSTSTRQDNEYRSMLENAGVKIISYLIQDIQEIYQLADCYIFPVRNQIGAIESPLSVLEAMACNLPIVSTKFGSLTSMFSQGGGFFFYQSEDELQKKISEALTVKVNTRNLVSSYSWSNICDNFSDVIEGI